MSRVYEALKQVEREGGEAKVKEAAFVPVSSVAVASEARLELDCSETVQIRPAQISRLVSLSEPKSLGAEKFRALATRIDNIRQEKQIKTIQIVSSTVNEGKTLVAANLSVTLASHTRSRVLLLEGDLHRPTLAGLLGLTAIKGLNHWWLAPEEDIGSIIYRIDGMPLWFMSAGVDHESPAKVLQSRPFTESFQRLRDLFDWIVVDSTPMLPVSDVNLWSRLVDGTLLVIREGIAPIAALEKGLASLDNPKLIGTVLNAATEVQGSGYSNQYYDYGSHLNPPRKTNL